MRISFLIVALANLPAWTQTSVYTLNGGAASQSGQTYKATNVDQSAVYVLNGGVLTLTNPTITKSANASNLTTSNQYGVNSAVLGTGSSQINIASGVINTAASGASGLFATGSSSSIAFSNGDIQTAGPSSSGVNVTYGATIILNSVNIATIGDSASAVFTGSGGGTITVNGGTLRTTGSQSPAIHSSGVVTVSNTNMAASGAEGAVIDGANILTLNGSNLAGQLNGIRIFASAPTNGAASVTINGGSVTSASTDAIYAAASTALIIRNGAVLSGLSGNLVNATAGSKVTLLLDGETLKGNLISDSTSALTATLQNGTTLTGGINKAAVTLDATSIWSVTGNSTVTTLADSTGISGNAVSNIYGNGFLVFYDPALNPSLASQTYTLAKGGLLLPIGSTVVPVPSIDSTKIVNSASALPGIASNTLVLIGGANLAPFAAVVSATDTISGVLPTTYGGVSVTVNGTPAYVWAVSPTAVGVLIPNGIAVGPAALAVTNSSGSATATVQVAATMPGVFTSSEYVVALRPADGVVVSGSNAGAANIPLLSLVGAAVSYPTTTAASGGDVLTIYCTGLGMTAPGPASGLVFTGAYPLNEPLTATVGGTPATVIFAGLVGPALYQVTFAVPTGFAAGSYAVVVAVDGTDTSGQTAMLKLTGS